MRKTKYRYILERLELVSTYNYSYKWKQLILSNDLEYLKTIANTAKVFRIIDVSTGIDEVYRTAPEYHYDCVAIASQINAFGY